MGTCSLATVATEGVNIKEFHTLGWITQPDHYTLACKGKVSCILRSLCRSGVPSSRIAAAMYDRKCIAHFLSQACFLSLSSLIPNQ
jgi:hypothetical protein